MKKVLSALIALTVTLFLGLETAQASSEATAWTAALMSGTFTPNPGPLTNVWVLEGYHDIDGNPQVIIYPIDPGELTQSPPYPFFLFGFVLMDQMQSVDQYTIMGVYNDGTADHVTVALDPGIASTAMADPPWTWDYTFPGYPEDTVIGYLQNGDLDNLRAFFAAQISPLSPYSSYFPAISLSDTTPSASTLVNFSAAKYGGAAQILLVPPPIANAGPAQTVQAGVLVQLDGSNSYPASGSATYQWTQQSGPNVTLSDPSIARPSFTAPPVGPGGACLVFQLTVTKGNQAAQATCTVTVTGLNQPPVANAGAGQTVQPGGSVQLDGSKSTPGATYQWTQSSGPPVTLSDATSTTPSFTAPTVGPGGACLVFTLTVTDPNGLTATDTCIVIVPSLNQPPVANAGADQTVNAGTLVTLDGSSSTDLNDGIASYFWAQLSGTPITLSDPKAVQPTFTAPQVPKGGQTLTFQLTVTDKGGLKSTATCAVNVQWVNTPPTAKITIGNIETSSMEWVNQNLNGTASDADGDTLSYKWVADGTKDLCDWQSVGADGTTPLSLANVPRLSTGDHTITLQVNDGYVTVTSSPMTLTVDLTAPTVNITGGSGDYVVNQDTQASFTVTLRASVMDFDGVQLTCAWSDCFSGGVPKVIKSWSTTPAAGVLTDLTPCMVSGLSVGTHKLTLTVFDGFNTVTKDITVTITMDNVVPTATPRVSPGILWPPNKAMVPVTIATGAGNTNGDPVQITYLQVACQDNGKPYGTQGIDWTNPVASSDGKTITLNLCADRLGTGTGRIYTISFKPYNPVSDMYGSQVSVTVTVPHDQGKK